MLICKKEGRLETKVVKSKPYLINAIFIISFSPQLIHLYAITKAQNRTKLR